MGTNQSESVSASAEKDINYLSGKTIRRKRFTQKDIASYLGVTPSFLA